LHNAASSRNQKFNAKSPRRRRFVGSQGKENQYHICLADLRVDKWIFECYDGDIETAQRNSAMKKTPKVSELAAAYYASDKERLNIYLPKDLVDDLRRLVPNRERTQFVIDALTKALRRARMAAALEQSYGAWRDEDHPELATFEDINNWIDENRRMGTRDWSAEWGDSERQ
jgi:hypothetical protein